MNSGTTGSPPLRAAEWNGWTDSEHLLQLAGHLRGKARQEFALVSADDQVTFASAIVAMGGKLDAGCRALVAQDFYPRSTDSGVTNPGHQF